MPVYCGPCRRSFQEQKDLDRHKQNSSAHKKPAQRSSQGGQASLPVTLQAIIPSQQEQGIRAEAQPAEPQRTVKTGYHLSSTTEGKPGQAPNEFASSSNASLITKPAVNIASQGVNSRWSVIAESEYPAILNTLSAHCHSPKELQENGYILQLYNPLDKHNNLRKCKRCNRKEMDVADRECTFHTSKRNKRTPEKPYKCCSSTDGKGCKTRPAHDFQLTLRAIQHKDFRKTPVASAEPKFRAVVLDCEMAGIAGGSGEAILLCATDYVTGAVLLNRFVCPRERITQMRSSIHGISKATLDHAIAQRQALSGWEGARSELWKYIDDSTILIGHALKHDLDALRIIHSRVVDSEILSRKAIGIGHMQFGLQRLCSELLSVEIRKNKGGIHDCLEDVLATREVVLFCTQGNEAFRSWVEAKKREQILLEKERERARQEKERQKALEEKENKQATKDLGKARSKNRPYFDPEDEDDEIVHWSDVAEDMGYPHPDTGYDPWSD